MSLVTPGGLRVLPWALPTSLAAWSDGCQQGVGIANSPWMPFQTFEGRKSF